MTPKNQAQTILTVGDVIHVNFNEDRRPQREMGWITKAIFVAFVATWIFQTFAQWLNIGFLQTIADTLWNNGVLDKTVWTGQVWRFVTHMFLHGGWMHLFGNVLGLVCFAVFARNCFSGRGWLLVYFGGGLTAALLQLMMTPDAKMVGASGGIMALWGATIAATIRFKRAPDNERPWEHVVPLSTSLKWLVFQFVIEQFIANVGHWAHLGGLLGGLLIGAVITLRGAPALLANRSGLVIPTEVSQSTTRDKRKFLQKVALTLTRTFDKARDYIVVEWETIDVFNRRHFSYETVVGTAPGNLRRSDLVELVHPYTQVKLEKLPAGATAFVTMESGTITVGVPEELVKTEKDKTAKA